MEYNPVSDQGRDGMYRKKLGLADTDVYSDDCRSYWTSKSEDVAHGAEAIAYI